MKQATAWWVTGWLLLVMGQSALSRMSVIERSQLKPHELSPAVRATAKKVKNGLRLKWVAGKGMRFQVQSSHDRTTWRKVGAVREGTGESDFVVVPVGCPRYFLVVRVDSPKQPAPVCENRSSNQFPSGYWRLFLKESSNGLRFCGPRNISRQPGQTPGLHRLDRPNRSSRFYWLNEATRVR